ncbi:hypothetical protein ILUMI_22991 [Ignelater luminosus]|uniref:FCP1 homology domain-containing protein n=1 Tax=Ignelater luminosus TaxID=2038154 RepID=A0A8K0CBP9_IGNLU|nr:hypothetical protein ILUMI_22991 [Ignelater luminosus]
MGDFLKLKVRWNNKILQITVKPQDTLADLKDMIYVITNIEPHRQNFPNLPTSANLWDDDYLLQDLDVNPDFVLEMADLLCEPLPSTSTAEPSYDFIDFSGFNTMLQPSNVHAGSGDQLVFDIKGFKSLSSPRHGKKLIVLDVDQTIYDYLGPTRHLAGRPFLHEFLAGVYEDYDIGIWSATDMITLENKMEALGMTTHPDYKLLFLMDKYYMITIPMEGQMVRVKPLDSVWAKYRQFDKMNTIMCDDLKRNFYLNPRNGIVVSPYSYKAHHKDDELLDLLSYLKTIANCDNFAALDHSSWKK